MGTARHGAQCGGEGPGHHRADAWGAPLDLCDPLLGLGLRTPQAAQLAALARGQAPRVGQQRATRAECRRPWPRGALPSIPTTHQAPTGWGHQPKLRPLGFALAGHSGPVCDQLRAGTREQPGEFLGFHRDSDAAQASVRQVDGQSLRVAAIRFDSIVRGHCDRRWIDHCSGSLPICDSNSRTLHRVVRLES